MRKPIAIFAVSAVATVTSLAALAAIDKPECIVGAKPGGGFDLTCKLAQQSLQDLKIMKEPMRATYMPGGIGAVAMNTVVAQRAADPNVIVAFSVAAQHRSASSASGFWRRVVPAAVGTDTAPSPWARRAVKNLVKWRRDEGRPVKVQRAAAARSAKD
jgi:putative tricarboxylic transport membrane protein